MTGMVIAITILAIIFIVWVLGAASEKWRKQEDEDLERWIIEYSRKNPEENRRQ